MLVSIRLTSAASSGYLTVVATSLENTIVRVTPKVAVVGGGVVPDLEAGTEYEFMLEEGEVRYSGSG